MIFKGASLLSATSDLALTEQLTTTMGIADAPRDTLIGLMIDDGNEVCEDSFKGMARKSL